MNEGERNAAMDAAVEVVLVGSNPMAVAALVSPIIVIPQQTLHNHVKAEKKHRGLIVANEKNSAVHDEAAWDHHRRGSSGSFGKQTRSRRIYCDTTLVSRRASEV